MPNSPPRTLRSRIARVERAEFVGRRRELLVADLLFAADSPASVLLVHGPGGIGKSMLLREIGRRGSQAGWTPFTMLSPHAFAVEQPVALLDGRTQADGPALRAALATLPARAVVVVASREEPDPGWFEDGWEHVTLELPLAPLSAQESRVLLERLGLGEDRRRSVIVRWAGGSPLSLRLGATAAREDAGWAPGLESDALDAHLRRLAGTALEGPYADVFALACLTDVTPALLAEVLPGTDAPAALRWLAGSGIAEWRERLHGELVRRAPELERALRERLAPLDPETVRDALRSLHDPSATSAVPRARLQDAAAHAFGDTPDEQLQREVLLRGYFDPAGGHEAAARELHLSRAAYFRRLRAASERVAAYLARSGYSDHDGA